MCIRDSIYKFARHGKAGRFVSELFPYTARVSDELCVIKSLHTDAINHEPAILQLTTGNMFPGRPSIGSWLSYGLGAMNEELPTFVVMTSKMPHRTNVQALSNRLWSSGFLSPEHAAVALRSGSDPVLYLNNPKGVASDVRRAMIDGVNDLNRQLFERVGDPEINARISQYEMAFRMQTSVPELTDISKESPATLDAYGPEVRKPGTYAANCLLARRLLERDVRFVQLFHRGWDQHIAIARQLPNQCHDIDQPTAALIKDLKVRGLLEDTLVVFATEFGRTVFSQGKLGDPAMGRDHHGRAFTVWLAGGGIKGGIEYGATDDFCYNITENPVHLRDLHATILHCLGIDHAKFTHKFRGLNTRLTGVEEAHVVKAILA